MRPVLLEDTNTFPGRITFALKQAELRPIDLSRELSVSPPTVYQWTRGRFLPSTENIVKIADVLDVSIDWLLGDEL